MAENSSSLSTGYKSNYELVTAENFESLDLNTTGTTISPIENKSATTTRPKVYTDVTQLNKLLVLIDAKCWVDQIQSQSELLSTIRYIVLHLHLGITHDAKKKKNLNFLFKACKVEDCCGELLFDSFLVAGHDCAIKLCCNICSTIFKYCNGNGDLNQIVMLNSMVHSQSYAEYDANTKYMGAAMTEHYYNKTAKQIEEKLIAVCLRLNTDMVEKLHAEDVLTVASDGAAFIN